LLLQRRSLSDAAAAFYRGVRDSWKAAWIDSSLRAHESVAALPHRLPGELIVSLTSYPARFATLHRTLAGLLTQTLKPDRFVLWIGEDCIDALPPTVTDMKRLGLEIRGTTDLGPYTKLIGALRAFPDAFIVTADDDAYYEPTWLQSLVETHDPANPSILCQRAHRIRFRPDGSIAPYAEWQWDVQDEAGRSPSTDLFPTGVGGVLYPPGCLHPEVHNEAAFLELCPTNDDVWFYWMARRAGSTARKVGRRFAGISWPGSQRRPLARINLTTGNDCYVRSMIARYGMPTAPREPLAGS
jgi:hypothetical protein